jgi:hypothetical protein
MQSLNSTFLGRRKNYETSDRIPGADSSMIDWSKLDTSRRLREPPHDSFTRVDYQKRYGVSETTSRRHLQLALEAGKLKKTVVLVDGCLIPYYTVVKSDQDGVHSRDQRRGTKRTRVAD